MAGRPRDLTLGDARVPGVRSKITKIAPGPGPFRALLAQERPCSCSFRSTTPPTPCSISGRPSHLEVHTGDGVGDAGIDGRHLRHIENRHGRLDGVKLGHAAP